MKKFLAAAVIFSLFTTLALPVLAQTGPENFRQGEDIILKEGETINRDFFAFGEKVEIDGTVNGDVYAAGGTVVVDGTINGDLIAAGGTVEISGKVSQDVRVAGGQVTVVGSVGKNLTVGTGNLAVDESSSIGGSVVAGAGTINISAPVGGDIRVGSGSLTISNQVKGNIDAGVGSLRLRSKALIEGYLNYWSNSDASIDSSAKVSGKITRYTPTENISMPSDQVLGALNGFFLFLKIVSFFYTLAIGLLIIKLFPIFSQNVSDKIRKKPWPTLGWGTLIFVGVPIVTLVLLISVIGIPLALMTIPFYLISLYLVRIFGMLFIGQFVAEKLNWKINSYTALLVGVIIYYLAQALPVIGGLVTLLVLLFGLGAAVIAKRDFYLASRKKDLL